jgi:hypothetical protein
MKNIYSFIVFSSVVSGCGPGSIPPDEGVLEAVANILDKDAAAFATTAIVVDDTGTVDIERFLDNDLSSVGTIDAHHDVALVPLTQERLLFVQVVDGQAVVAAVLPEPGAGRGTNDVVAEQYQAAWNIADRDARSDSLTGAFAANGRYVDPTIDISGRPALVDHIDGWLSQQSTAVIAPVGGVEQRGDVATFAWEITGAGFANSVGLDVALRSEDGELTFIAGFFGER